MIRTIIIDDEKHCSDRVLKLISDHAPNLKVIKVCNNVEEAVDATKTLDPELVFLDIEMHDKTGFDYLEKLGSYNFNLIFTTAFDNYAIKAFKYSAMDYLLKPIDSDDFIQAIDKLTKRINTLDQELQIKLLLNNLNKDNQNKTIRIPTSEGFELITIEDIIHCEADSSYTHIFTTQSKLLVSKPIKYFDDLLKDDNFFRIHNSHMVNINHVKKYTKGKGGYVTMSNNATIDVSARKKDEFLKLFK